MPRYSLAWLLAMLALPSVCIAQCNLHSALLANVNRFGSSSGAHFTYATWYANAGCFNRARHELDLSDAAIPPENVDEDTKQTERKAGKDMRVYVDALEKASMGQSVAAKSLLFTLMADQSSRRSYSTGVLWWSLDTLSGIMRQNGTEAEWKRFETIMDGAPESIAGYWQVEFAKRLAEAHTGKLNQALAAVDGALAEGVDVQHYLSLQILLGELLVLDKKYDSARIQCASMDKDVSTLTADFRLKIRYLAMCQSAWSEGPKSDNALRAAESAQRSMDYIQGQL